MVVVADVTVGADAFPLGTLLKSDAGTLIEFERVVPTGHHPMEFFWIAGGHSRSQIQSVQSLDAIETVTVRTTVDDELLVQIRWATDRLNEFVSLLMNDAFVLLRAVGFDGKWTLRILCPDSGTLRTLYDESLSLGVQFEIDHLQTEIDRRRTSQMTEKQCEAVTAAFEEGFFEVPRRTTLGELAEGFGISEQALSKRIRRGVHAMLSENLHHTSG